MPKSKRMDNDTKRAVFHFTPSIFLPRYSGVRPIIKPQIKTAKIAYMIMFIKPTPFARPKSLKHRRKSGIIPPSGSIMHIIDQKFSKKEVVVVVNIAGLCNAKPNLLSFHNLSIYINPASANAGFLRFCPEANAQTNHKKEYSSQQKWFCPPYQQETGSKPWNPRCELCCTACLCLATCGHEPFLPNDYTPGSSIIWNTPNPKLVRIVGFL